MRVVLCSEHAKPLEDLLKVGIPAVSNAPGARIWTMEEIERERKRIQKNGNNK